MSGIVGSRFNTRGSGLVGSLGTDGQVFTSSGAGVGAAYEAAAGGGIVLQQVTTNFKGEIISTVINSAWYTHANPAVVITPASSDNDIRITLSGNVNMEGDVANRTINVDFSRAISGGSTTERLANAAGYGAAGYLANSVYDAPNTTYFTKNTYGMYFYTWVDSPSTTSAITYKVMGSSYSDTSGNYWWWNNGFNTHLTVEELSG